MILEHSIHPKGWGEEEWIINSELYCAKLLKVGKGLRCSLHYHNVKTETFTVLRGSVILRFGETQDGLTTILLSANESFHVPVGLLHQFEGLEDSEILEVSTQHFEEDSIRLVAGD